MNTSTKPMQFVHLHTHTHYSLLDGMASIKSLVDKAIADGMPGLAITDHGTMAGIKEFYDYVKKKNKELGINFKAILGCEVYVARNGRHNKSERSDWGGYHLILLAKNLQGYRNLAKIISNSWAEGYCGRPRTDHEQLERYHEGLICCSACIGGEVPQLILQDKLEEAEKAVLWHKSVFGEDYYLELQLHIPTVERANYELHKKQKVAMKQLLHLSEKHNIGLVCTNDVHFLNEDDAEAHDRLLCINTHKELNDPNRMLYSKQEWMKTTAEMMSPFRLIPEAMANTVEICDKIEDYSIDHEPIIPKIALPEGIATEEEYLEILVIEGAHKRYGEGLSEEVQQRLQFELHQIKTNSYPAYFLFVWDIVRVAREELNIWVGPGRGSAPSSLVVYCLGITQIDPIKHNLLFERFLNPDCKRLPDIDIDFEDNGRKAIVDWLIAKYGKEQVAYIASYGVISTKMAIQNVGVVNNLKSSHITRLCNLVTEHLYGEGERYLRPTLTNALTVVPQLQKAATSKSLAVRDTIKYAQRLEGVVNSRSFHCCGIAVCGENISNLTPTHTGVWTFRKYSAERTPWTRDYTATEYASLAIEDVGIVKMDFLELKVLTTIKDTVAKIRQNGIEIDIDKIPADDEQALKIFRDGSTQGVFQFESLLMQKLLQQLQPASFDELVALNALFRPGPMDYIPEYISRKFGERPIEYELPIMERWLQDTYGMIVYQEQIMQFAKSIANFTPCEADALRKAMVRRITPKQIELKAIFIKQGVANGYDETALKKVWSSFEKMGYYTFAKAHAVSYTWIAYQTAYLKAHFHTEFEESSKNG